jgi:hypothetical protein
MNELWQMLGSRWAGAPLIIWLAGFALGVFAVLALIIILVRTIRIGCKSRKLEFAFESDNTNKPEQITDKLLKTPSLPRIKTLPDNAKPKLIPDETKPAEQAAT